MSDVTRILQAIDRGERLASEELLPLVYSELRRLASARMANERPGQTLQATALVHEAYLRLIGGEEKPSWENRRHFFAAAAEAMRRILIEKARWRDRLRHGVELDRVDFADAGIDDPPDHLLELDEALQALEQEDAKKSELVKLRYFAGLTEAEAAAALGISRATASRWWTFAKAWLFERMQSE